MIWKLNKNYQLRQWDWLTLPRLCSRGSPGGWFWNLSKWNLKINTKGRFKEKKDNMILNLDFDLHLDDVLEVLPMVGVEFLNSETCILISKEESLINYDGWFMSGGDI